MNYLLSSREALGLWALTGGKATIRAVGLGHLEVRVPASAVKDVQEFYYHNVGACWRVDVLPLGEEEAFTSCVMILPPAKGIFL